MLKQKRKKPTKVVVKSEFDILHDMVSKKFGVNSFFVRMFVFLCFCVSIQLYVEQ